MVCAMRVLDQKAYGSIPHLPGSRTGPSDRHVDDPSARRLTEECADDARVIVREKLDGSCVAIAHHDGSIVALGRNGDLASKSRNVGRRAFALWVDEHTARFRELLQPGERFVGEWLGLVHSTHYDLAHEPLVVFDLMRGTRRALERELRERARGLVLPKLLHEGGPCSIDRAMAQLGEHGHHGAREPAEGAVWRLERGGRVALVAKYVRASKQDGLYLPDHTGEAPRWNAAPGFRPPSFDGEPT